MCRVPKAERFQYTHCYMRKRWNTIHTVNRHNTIHNLYIPEPFDIYTSVEKNLLCALCLCNFIKKTENKKKTAKKVSRPNFIVKIYFKYFYCNRFGNGKEYLKQNSNQPNSEKIKNANTNQILQKKHFRIQLFGVETKLKIACIFDDQGSNVTNISGNENVRKTILTNQMHHAINSIYYAHFNQPLKIQIAK